MVSDALLLSQVRQGEQDAFGELYRRHADVARGAARSLMSSNTEAEDVVAEAFTRVLSILQRGGGPEEAFRPYLLTCVRHACYDRTQGIARSTPTDPNDLTDLAHDRQRGQLDPHDGSSNTDLLARAFASLPERWQLVLWSTEVDGRRPHDLAKELGLAPGAVASLAYRAREGLTEAFLAAHLQRPAAPGCAAVRPRLAAFVRDNVPGREEAAIQDHLDQCTECQALVGELRELNRPLRGLLVPAVVGISAGSYAAATAGGGAFLPRLFELLQARPLFSGAATAGVALVATATFSGVAMLRPADGPVGTVVTSMAIANGSSSGSAGSAPRVDPSGPASGPVSGVPADAGTPPGVGPAPLSPAVPPGSSGDPAGVVTTPTVSLPAVSVPATLPVVDGTPVTLPPVTLPPVTLPPVTLPPITLPVSLPPVTLPPVTVPPVTLPPIVLPLGLPTVTLPPVTVPPVTVPPVTVPPATVPLLTVPLLTGTTAPP